MDVAEVALSTVHASTIALFFLCYLSDCAFQEIHMAALALQQMIIYASSICTIICRRMDAAFWDKLCFFFTRPTLLGFAIWPSEFSWFMEGRTQSISEAWLNVMMSQSLRCEGIGPPTCFPRLWSSNTVSFATSNQCLFQILCSSGSKQIRERSWDQIGCCYVAKTNTEVMN